MAKQAERAVWVVEDTYKVWRDENDRFVQISVESRDPDKLSTPSEIIKIAQEWLVENKGLSNYAVYEVTPPYPSDLNVPRGTVLEFQGDGPSPLHQRAAMVPPEERKFRVDVIMVSGHGG